MKIGIFDSGVGGITILNEVVKRLPNAEVVYLCDNKNLPYGDKSVEFIKNRLAVIMNYFKNQNCDSVIIACHSAASVYIKNRNSINCYGMKVVDVISPTCIYLHSLPSTSIGIMATDRTIEDKTYKENLNPPHDILDFPSGNLATIIETQHIENSDATSAIIASEPFMQNFLSEILCESKLKTISKMILACTHYPHVIQSIKNWIGIHTNNCEIIDPANIVVSSFDLKSVLPFTNNNKINFFTTGNFSTFKAFCNNSPIIKNSNFPQYSINEIDL